jgi:hypothetical protein
MVRATSCASHKSVRYQLLLRYLDEREPEQRVIERVDDFAPHHVVRTLAPRTLAHRPFDVTFRGPRVFLLTAMPERPSETLSSQSIWRTW